MNGKALWWALAASLFFIVLGSRWAAAYRYGTDVPEWDQWDAEGLTMLAPWADHRLTPGDFLQPQNEHRVVLTKLLNFGLTAANGQWDQRLECAANAILPGIIALAFFIFGCRTLSRPWRLPLFLLLAAAYALPLSWQNVLGGFHSQQFFLIGLSFGAIGWLPCAKPWSRSWWLGAACAALALGSMASGLLAAVVVIGLLAVRLLRRETSLAAAGPAFLVCAGLAALGWLTRVSVYYHQVLKAHSAQDFVMTIVHSLQWPGYWTAWTALLIWLPWCWLTWRVLTGAPAADRASGITLAGLGGWVVLQIIAAGYERGAGAPLPASRYIDTLVFGAVVNGIAVGWLWEHGALAPRGRRILAWLGLAWAVVFGAGVACDTFDILKNVMPGLKTYHYYCEQNTRNYLATGDETYLQHAEIPFPSTESYLVRLRVPELRSLLPVSVRDPLTLTGGNPGSPFVRHDSRSRLPSPTGLSPGTPPLTNRVTWGSFPGVAGKWESAALSAPRSGWLKFEVAGQLGGPGVALELRDAGTHALLAAVVPDKVPGDSWRSTYVRAPNRAFVLVARDEDSHRWFAFSEPVEMGPLSQWAWRGMKNGLLMAELAAVAAVLLTLSQAWLRRFL